MFLCCKRKFITGLFVGGDHLALLFASAVFFDRDLDRLMQDGCVRVFNISSCMCVGMFVYMYLCILKPLLLAVTNSESDSCTDWATVTYGRA